MRALWNKYGIRVLLINRATLLDNLTNQYGRQYGSGAKSTAEQAVKLRYVPKTTFTIIAPIPAPTSPISSSITSSSATIGWTAASGAESYEVRYGTTSGSLGAATDVGNVTSYALSGLTDETTYYFQVRTKIGSEYSAWTEEASFTTLAAAAHTHNGITFSKWATTTSLPTSGTYYLNDDVTFDEDITLTGNLTLCLNGKTVLPYGARIIIPDGKTLTIYDNEGDGKIAGYYPSSSLYSSALVTIQGGGTLVISEGAIQNLYETDEDGNSYAIFNQGTLKLSGAPAITGEDAGIYLGTGKVITIESGKPLTNTTPYVVGKSTIGTITSGWANMGGAPSDHFAAAGSGHGIALVDGEAKIVNCITLAESTDNSSAITAQSGQTINVSLTRSFTSAQYNTVCLPFELSDAQLQAVFGTGYDLEEFSSSSLEDETLNLAFNKVTSLTAGKPYLIQPSQNVVNPTLDGVTITATAPADQTSDTYISFHGTFSPTELEGGNKNLLFLGAGNELFWPEATGNLNGFRAYFEVKGAAQKVAKRARIVQKDNTATGLENQMVNGKCENGKFLHDGQLYLMYEGKMYDVRGQRVR